MRLVARIALAACAGAAANTTNATPSASPSAAVTSAGDATLGQIYFWRARPGSSRNTRVTFEMWPSRSTVRHSVREPSLFLSRPDMASDTTLS